MELDRVSGPTRARCHKAKALARQSATTFVAADAASNPDEKTQLLADAQALAVQSAFADAYAFLQKAVGVVAVTLPFVLIIGGAISEHEVQGSLSAYYYTRMGNYFVGSLCALAVFFLSYNYRPLPKYHLDNILSDLACVTALGVAFLPTMRDAATADAGSRTIGIIHLASAATLFALLGVFSYFLFTKTETPDAMTSRKKLRNAIYRTCGVVIAGALVLLAVTERFTPPSSWHAFLALESIAVIAFGVSWLVKGEFLGLFADTYSSSPITSA